MALSSDQSVKTEIKNQVGTEINGLTLRMFPESSKDDKKPFHEGGLTFGIKGVLYGSCDACWFKKGKWKNPFNNETTSATPVVVLEVTDALNRGSSGNAQHQRFHHVLGAVRAGIIGVYYLKEGNSKIQEELFEMAYSASKEERGTYLIMDGLEELKNLLLVVNDAEKLKKFIEKKLDNMHSLFKKKFEDVYGGSWNKFAEKRSSIIKGRYIIKYSGRMKRNFTDGSQRAGHIAVGEMFLTKYFFVNKFFFYLWPKMTSEDVKYLDRHKKKDKEWILLRNEKNVRIITVDDLEGVNDKIKEELKLIKDKPLKGGTLRLFNKNVKIIVQGLKKDTVSIKEEILNEVFR